MYIAASKLVRRICTCILVARTTFETGIELPNVRMLIVKSVKWYENRICGSDNDTVVDARVDNQNPGKALVSHLFPGIIVPGERIIE